MSPVHLLFLKTQRFILVSQVKEAETFIFTVAKDMSRIKIPCFDPLSQI